jgi:hypothetical protein
MVRLSLRFFLCSLTRSRQAAPPLTSLPSTMTPAAAGEPALAALAPLTSPSAPRKTPGISSHPSTPPNPSPISSNNPSASLSSSSDLAAWSSLSSFNQNICKNIIHTWSHPSSTTSTNEIIAEFKWSRKSIKDVLVVTLNMMRSPFGDIGGVAFFSLLDG